MAKTTILKRVRAESAEETFACSSSASANTGSTYGGGKFGPDDPITREQPAAILREYS